MFYTSAAEYYKLLSRAFLPVERPAATVAERYILLGRLLRELLDERVSDAPLTFSGNAAQINYLVRKYQIPSSAARLLQTMRGHLHAIDPQAEEDAAPLAHDLYAFCLLVYYVCERSLPPTELRSCFPRVHDLLPSNDAVKGYIRAEVASCDGRYLYLNSRKNSRPFRALFPEPIATRRSLADYCQGGATVHLIRPRAERQPDGDMALNPELIIYEPDYLVNISSIAACFRPEGVSPFSHLVSRLRPSPISSAIELGNLAGELLDLHVHHKSFSTEEAILQCARRRVLVASSPRIDYSFLAEEAKQQSEFIDTALNKTLPSVSSVYQREALLLEPSFYGQLLGLEGRMDLLQENLRLLIEQKSGKGAYYHPGDRTPIKQEGHYVQILLYQALLTYALQQRGEIESYLLYSKYPAPLLSVGRAPALLQHALSLRNELVAYDAHYRRFGFSVLRTLSPEDFNTRQVANKLWEEYTAPELDAFLTPCQSASPLAWSYFVRLSRSVMEEQFLAKVGSGTSHHYGAAGRWLYSVGERREAGMLLTHLAVHLDPSEEGHYRQLRFTPLEKNNALANTSFRVGDLVAVYPCQRGKLPDIRRQVFLKGKITELGATQVGVHLNYKQSSDLIFSTDEGGYWVIEGDSNDSSFSSQFQGLYSFLRCGTERQELILQQRLPRIDASRVPRGEYGELQTLVQRVVQARELFLVLGPPGTGKTSHVMMSILREELLTPDTHILLSAFTHRAVNEMASKVHAAGINFLYIASPLVATPELVPYLLEQRVRDTTSVAEMRAVIAEARVVCINTSALAAHLELLETQHFSLAIIDEASQLLEGQLLPLLCANQTENRHPIERFVLIGDHKQLPAIVQQDAHTAWVEEPELRAIGLTDCRNSFFERFYRTYCNEPSVTYFLSCQARMHPDIADFVSKHFYEGRLTVRGVPHQLQALPSCPPNTPFTEKGYGFAEDIPMLIAHHRFFFVDYMQEEQGVEPPYQNAKEASLIVTLVRGYIDYYSGQERPLRPSEDIGIILPYRRQITRVREALRKADIPAVDEMTIDTVERYQGSERKIIIYGFTASTIHQLNFLTNSTMEENGRVIDRKLNVAMTRAREHLVLVGYGALLRHVPLFAELLAK